MRILFLLLLIPVTLASSETWAQNSPIEALEFTREVDEKRYHALLKELRCTVCQNEPLDSSNAPLAADLRRQVYVQILDGRADFEIRDYMRERYGDFVLYNPPFAGHTLVLWLGPIVLLLAGLATGAVMVRQRRQMLRQSARN
ncbi:MAG: cytochrome c-type biogenesis protein [Wenzhouxiangellaceae bacterium]|nr:cytochrome c-type biogenesis protein [Wenzhouxiangellaceae bacterium]